MGDLSDEWDLRPLSLLRPRQRTGSSHDEWVLPEYDSLLGETSTDSKSMAALLYPSGASALPGNNFPG